MTASDAQTIVVIGDVHTRLDVALAGLDRIENEYGKICQVFSVGDVGLFLDRDDWNYLTGPSKHRHPERSDLIAAAWEQWRWPLAMIGGNHEPYHRLRTFDTAHFGSKLTYTNAGALKHQVDRLNVYGLSGIYHPDHLSFGPSVRRGEPKPRSWDDLVRVAKGNKAALKRLTYYKQEELDLLLGLPPEPGLLLLHDWPVAPPHFSSSGIRPEKILVERLRPRWICSGHHHTSMESQIGASNFIALNTVTRGDDSDASSISAGWAAVFTWTGERLEKVSLWPSARHASAMV